MIETIWLSVLTAVLVFTVTALLWKKFANGSTDKGSGEGRKVIVWRKNVLCLLGVAYGSLIGMFALMSFLGGVPAMEAYDKISVPFVALIGGTLAVVKDLID